MIRATAAVALIAGLLVGCSSEPYYRTCKDAQDAGASLPLTPESPGWNPKLDRDGNGEAC